MNLKSYILNILVLFCSVAYTQKVDKDIERNIALFEKYLYTDIDSSKYYLSNFLLKSNSVKDEKLIALCNFYYGKLYYVEGNFKESQDKLWYAERFALKSNSLDLLTKVYNLQAIIYSLQDNKPKALKKYILALKISEKINQEENQSKILINLGGLYLERKDSIKFLECLDRSIYISKKNNFSQLLSKAYLNKAIYFGTKNVKQAIDLFTLSLIEAKKVNDYHIETQVYVNLSQLYLNQKELKSAYKYLVNAYNSQKKNNDKSLLFYIYFNYGAYYLELKQIPRAIKYFLSAKQISDIENIPSERVLELYRNLYEAYVHQDKHESALYYLKKYDSIKDEIFTLKSEKVFQDIQTKYEVDKKNLKIDLLNKDNQLVKSKKNLILYVSILVFIILVTTSLMLRSKIKVERVKNQKKQILHQQEIVLLNKEQELKQIKANYDGQNNERNRISKEIHDGVGATLASLKLQLLHINEELNNSKIQKITNQLTNIFKELREISHNLSSNYFEGKELDRLLLELFKKFNSEKKFKINLYIFPEDSLADFQNSRKVNLYRIFQELLINTKKYAKAKTVSISITKHDHYCNIIYEDDGIGFLAEKVKKGIGLNNIRDRVALEKGEFIIESKQNIGTTVIINIPNNYV